VAALLAGCTSRSAADGGTWWPSCTAGWSSLGLRCIRGARSGRGRRWHASFARRCSPSRTALRAGSPRPHGGRARGSRRAIGFAVRSSNLASRGGFLALLGHLGAQRGHLDSDRGARGRDDSVSAERPRCSASGAGVHADSVPCSLPRDVRGLRPLTGRGTSKLGVSCSSLFWVASSGWVGWRPLGLGWDGEMVVPASLTDFSWATRAWGRPSAGSPAHAVTAVTAVPRRDTATACRSLGGHDLAP
jgi:hypothetical protein